MGTNVMRHLMAGVLSGVAILMAFFIPVAAEETYPIWVGNTAVTSAVTSGDGWSYEGDETGGTLTLTDATFSKGTYYGINATVPLKIVLVGENKMEEGLSFGIYSTSEITIEGKGSLDVSGITAGIYANGIIINGTNITVNSSVDGFRCEKWHRFDIVDSTVVCDGKKNGIYAEGCLLSINNSTVTAHGGDYGINTTEIKADDGSTIVAESDNGVAVVAPTGLTSNDSDITISGKTQGVDTLYLELNGGKFRASGSETTVGNPYTIKLGEEMHIVSPENGSVQTVIENHNKRYYFANSDGTRATDVFVRESKVKAVTNGQKDLVAIDKPLADEGDTVTVTVNDTFYYIVKNITAKDSDGQSVVVQENEDGKYTFTMPAKDVTVNIEFGHPDKYPVWIGEHQVAGENDSGSGWSCEVDENGATLTLNGINLEHYNDAVNSLIPLTVVLVGENKLITTARNSINAGSSLVIKGDGSLSLQGTIMGKSDIKISDGAHINIFKSDNGIATTEVLTIENSAIDVNGTFNALYVTGGTINITNSSVNCTTLQESCVLTRKLTVDSSIVSAQGMYGIFTDTCTVENGSSITVNSDSLGVIGKSFSSSNSKINITAQNADGLNFFNKVELFSGTVSVKCTDGNAVISQDGSLTLGENMTITVPENGAVSSDGKTIVDSNNEIAKEVILKGTFHVNIDAHNRVRIDKTDFAPGETVDFSIWDDDKYTAFRDLNVTDQNGDQISVTDKGDRTYSFTMPESAVTIHARFEDAEIYGVVVGGENLTDFFTSGEGWRYVGDKTGGTLYLENAKISNYSAAIRTDVPLTIVLKGNNVVEQLGSGFAIYSYNAPITIKGSGSLQVKSYTGAMYAKGITICGGATITAEGMYGLNSYGEGMSITDSKVSIKSQSEAALYDNSGSVNSIVIKNSTVECSSYNYTISTIALTIDNSTVECSSNNVVMYISTLTIDNSTVQASGITGINVSKTLSVQNGSNLTVNANYNGIEGRSVSFSNSNVHVESNNAYALTHNGIVIDGGSVYAKGKYGSLVTNSNKITLGENMVILIPENGKLNDQENAILDSDGANANEVLIEQNYKVTVTAGDNGTATASVPSGLEGTEVTLTATPDEGCLFKEWQVVKGGITISDPGSETATFTIGTADVEVKAIFEAKPTPSPEPTATPTTKPAPSAAPTSAAKPTTIPSAAPTSPAKPTNKPATKPTAVPTKAAEPTKASTVTIKFNKTKADLVCGKNLTLKATLTGSKDKITWKSSDKKVATVDANGKVTAKMAGQATITASAAGKSATCVVTVLYKDVTNSKDFWYAPTNYLTAKGVVKGYANQTEFRPANVCTRAQMVTFIWRLQGEPKPKTTTCKFKDVKKTDYFYKACIWGNENHIVEGYKDGTFGPQIVCARKHAVTFLWRLANKPKPASSANKFKDVKKSDYFYTATLWASEKGILAGYSDGTFRPNGDCLRRQMVTFLSKYDKFVNKKG